MSIYLYIAWTGQHERGQSRPAFSVLSEVGDCFRLLKFIRFFTDFITCLLVRFITARRSYASVVLGVVVLSVRPSVRHTCALWQKQTMDCRHFHTTRKGNHSSFLTRTVVGGRRLLLSDTCAQSWPTPSKKCRLRQISAYNVSTVKDSGKVQWWMGSRPRALQRTIDGVRALHVSPAKGGSKSDFLLLWANFNFNQIKSGIQSFFVWKLLAVRL